MRGWFWPFVIGVVCGGGLSFASAELVVNSGADYAARLPQDGARPRAAGSAMTDAILAMPSADNESADVERDALGATSNGWLTGNDPGMANGGSAAAP